MEIKFNEVKTRNELADFLKIGRKTLIYVLYNKYVENYYDFFEIPKKSGGYREIHASTGTLKMIQKKLSNCLYNYREHVYKDNGIKINNHMPLKEKKVLFLMQMFIKTKNT